VCVCVCVCVCACVTQPVWLCECACTHRSNYYVCRYCYTITKQWKNVPYIL